MLNNRQRKKQAAEKHNAEYIENKGSPLFPVMVRALSAEIKARIKHDDKSKRYK